MQCIKNLTYATAIVNSHWLRYSFLKISSLSVNLLLSKQLDTNSSPRLNSFARLILYLELFNEGVLADRNCNLNCIKTKPNRHLLVQSQQRKHQNV